MDHGSTELTWVGSAIFLLLGPLGCTRDQDELTLIGAEKADSVEVDATGGPDGESSDPDVQSATDVSPPIGTAQKPVVRENPGNSLSCYVEWETDTPTHGSVEVKPLDSSDGSFTHRTRTPPNDVASRQHRILVVGLYEGDWTLRAVTSSTVGPAGRSEPVTWTSKPGPAAIPHGDVLVTSEGLTDDWLLTHFGRGDPNKPGSTWTAMFDRQGRLRWYRPLEGGLATLSTSVNDGTAVLMAGGAVVEEVDLSGKVLWRSPAEPEGDYNWFARVLGSWHHEFVKLSNGNYGMLRIRPIDDAIGRVDTIEEMSPAGDVIWAFPLTTLDDAVGAFNFGSAATFDLSSGKVLYACRNTGVVARIDIASKELDWILGEGRDFAKIGADWEWFATPHSTLLLPGGDILLFDGGPIGVAGATRIMQLHLDEGARTAEFVWQYPPPESSDRWSSPAGGSVSRLPNGNTFIAGVEGKDGGLLEFERTRFLEVNWEHEVLFHLTLPGSALVYRASVVPAALEPIPPS